MGIYNAFICNLHIKIEMDTTISRVSPQRRRTQRRICRILAAMVVVLSFRVSSAVAERNSLDGFAQCLAEKKATMYGSFLCPHCDDQKKLFGSSFKYVPYVECSERGSRQMTFPCIVAHIRFTPTWIFADGERRTGVQSLKNLSVKTECALP
jgi:hypothetical protein